MRVTGSLCAAALLLAALAAAQVNVRTCTGPRCGVGCRTDFVSASCSTTTINGRTTSSNAVCNTTASKQITMYEVDGTQCKGVGEYRSFMCGKVFNNSRLGGSGFGKFSGCAYYPTETIVYHSGCDARGAACKHKLSLPSTASCFELNPSIYFAVFTVSAPGSAATFNTYDGSKGCRGKPTSAVVHPTGLCIPGPQGLQYTYMC
jgi:hypothetical protein